MSKQRRKHSPASTLILESRARAVNLPLADVVHKAKTVEARERLQLVPTPLRCDIGQCGSPASTKSALLSLVMCLPTAPAHPR